MPTGSGNGEGTGKGVYKEELANAGGRNSADQYLVFPMLWKV